MPFASTVPGASTASAAASSSAATTSSSTAASAYEAGQTQTVDTMKLFELLAGRQPVALIDVREAFEWQDG